MTSDAAERQIDVGEGARLGVPGTARDVQIADGRLKGLGLRPVLIAVDGPFDLGRGERFEVVRAALEDGVGAVRICLGHNDLLPANFIKGPDKMWLVDWEYGGFNSPLFDLGGLASNAGILPELEAEMLRRYYGHAPDTSFMKSYAAMKCGSLLRETMWSMVSEITSEIDFDYAAYTAENLDRFDAALAAWKDM